MTCGTVLELTNGGDCELCCLYVLPVLVVRTVSIVAFRGMGFVSSVAIAEGVLDSQLYLYKISVGPVQHFFNDGALYFQIFCALSFSRALWSYSPFDWLAKKLCFHEKLV